MDPRLLAGPATLMLGAVVVGIELLGLIESAPVLLFPVGVLALAAGTLLVGTSGTIRRQAA
ncbi:hypothetical protein [Halorientalis regularis]|jgi:hypothetical protein|uniref:Uncharacterized protein n=1 Tax=Halorientalis regularis TaxID=660518 RepID=A0A1G7HVD6_9EURY|nr:hypothetical protein [Halorientalis regularis]SDF04430.1 hypothetical protein SAMN05216218_103175 [Halorientalis regularis]